MSYTRIQFIAHCINTEPIGAHPLNLPIFSLPGDDIAARLELFKEAIEEARKQISVKDQVLKIFMMPKLFFRGGGGAYPENEFFLTLVLGSLQQLVVGKKWEDWIFVSTLCCKDLKEGKEYNFSLVQKGGFDSPEKSCGYLIPDGSVTSLDTHLRVLKGQYQMASIEGTFNIGNIEFGLEFDENHESGRLRKAKKFVDIQLIPSYGTAIIEGEIAVRDNGYVFNCDGKAFPHSEFKKDPEYVGAINVASVDSVRSSHSSLVSQKTSSVSSLFGVKWSPCKLSKRYNLNKDVSKIFVGGAGELHFYEEVPFPPFTTSRTDVVTSKSLFPSIESKFTATLSNEPVLLNGMKVIFDQPVSVYPVTLESKAEAGRNDT